MNSLFIKSLTYMLIVMMTITCASKKKSSSTTGSSAAKLKTATVASVSTPVVSAVRTTQASPKTIAAAVSSTNIAADSSDGTVTTSNSNSNSTSTTPAVQDPDPNAGVTLPQPVVPDPPTPLPPDTTPPGAPTVTGITLTTQTQPTWSFTSAGGTGSGTFRVLLDSDQFTGLEPAIVGTTYVPSAPLADGVHMLYVEEVSAAGIWSDAGSHAIGIDTLPPLPAADILIRSAFNSLTSSPVFSFTASLGDQGLAGLASYEYAVFSSADNTQVQPWTNIGLSVAGQASDLTLTEGNSYYIQVHVLDNLGLISSAISSHSWLVDVTPPVITIDTPTEDTAIYASAITFSGACEAGRNVVFSYSSGITGPMAMTCPTGSYAAILNLSLPYATKTVTVSQTDAAGNVGQAVRNIAYTITTPTQLALMGPSGVTAGQCLPYTIESQTSFGVASAVTANATVNFTVNNGTGSFYRDSNCTSVITSANIASTTANTTVYFKSVTAPQYLTLVLTSAALSATTASVAVGSTPTELLIDGAPSLVIGTCTQYDVMRVDTYGNILAANNSVDVALVQDKNAVFYLDSSCSNQLSTITIPANQQSISFYIKDQTVEYITLSASDQAALLTGDTFSLNVASTLSWWNTSWTQRRRIEINNLDQATTFTNQPVLVKLDASRIDYNAVQSGGGDIRFIAADNVTPLSYEIEKWNNTGTSYVWVQIPSIPASSNSVSFYMYYGNIAATDAQTPKDVWTSYYSVWHLGENSTAAAPQFKDSSQSNHNGSAINGPLSSTSPIGTGVTFGGQSTKQAIDVGFNLAPVIGQSNVTFSAWIKTTQVGNDTDWMAPGITGLESNGDENDIFFGWIDAAGHIAVSAGNQLAAKSTFIVNDNAWRHVTITRNLSSGFCQFFVNGVLTGSGTSEAGAKATTAATAFSKLGVIWNSVPASYPPVYFNGTLDEVRIFNTVQSSAKIMADYKFQIDTHLRYDNVEILPNF